MFTVNPIGLNGNEELRKTTTTLDAILHVLRHLAFVTRIEFKLIPLNLLVCFRVGCQIATCYHRANGYTMCNRIYAAVPCSPTSITNMPWKLREQTDGQALEKRFPSPFEWGGWARSENVLWMDSFSFSSLLVNALGLRLFIIGVGEGLDRFCSYSSLMLIFRDQHSLHGCRLQGLYGCSASCHSRWISLSTEYLPIFTHLVILILSCER